jgi:protein SCO1/2
MIAAPGRLSPQSRFGAVPPTISDLEIVPVSLDRPYATPGVFKVYFSFHNIDTSNYSLVTGPKRAIGQLRSQLGVFVSATDGVLQHSLSTFRIGADGKILFREDGSDWLPEHFLQQLKTS